jgi:homoserine O-succinyltransferase/O-acetyltransferase
MNGTGQRARGQQDLPLSIGLLNNASDRALKTTEAQFVRMLRAASAGFDLGIKLFTCPEIPRSVAPLDHAGDPYADIEHLFDAPLDALIVTGMEPQAKALQDEPVWDNITRLVDWATQNSVPVIWSCLAAHAAVLYLDGIARSRLNEKLLGVFACHVLATDHMLASGLPSRWASPHSRYHGLSQATLLGKGYQILSSSDEAGVDVFMKEEGPPFLFFQGHPEYEADTLWRQYRRDVRRYLVAESNEYPLAPRNYFDPATEATLLDVRDRAMRSRPDPRDIEMTLGEINGAANGDSWERPAIGLYANWLTLVAQQSAAASRRDPWINQALFALTPEQA